MIQFDIHRLQKIAEQLRDRLACYATPGFWIDPGMLPSPSKYVVPFIAMGHPSSMDDPGWHRYLRLILDIKNPEVEVLKPEYVPYRLPEGRDVASRHELDRLLSMRWAELESLLKPTA